MRGIAAVTALLLVGCFRANTTYCPATGAECPDDLACAPAPVYCGSAAAVGACSGVSDHEPCVGEAGVCLTGVCTPCTQDLFGCQYPGWVAMDSGTNEDLLAVEVIGPGDAFAVGASGTILHYDGLRWSAFASPTNAALAGVWADSDTDLVVLESGSLFDFAGSWTAISDPVSTRNELWGQSATNLLVTGYENGSADGALGQYTGGWSWYPVDTTVSRAPLDGVWASSASDVFVTDSKGDLLHYDGTWTMRLPGNGTNYVPELWGTSAGDLYAAGNPTAAQHSPVLLYSPDRTTSWTDETSKLPAGSGNLLGMWGASATDVYIVGAHATLLVGNTASWTQAATIPATSPDLHAIGGSSATDVYAVGAAGTIWHYTGM